MLASMLYKSIYTYFADTTPLKFDCGTLCNKSCCSCDENEIDDETGMYLFPGEEALFYNNPDFKIITSEFVYGNKNADIVVCKGICKREMRPLSCRIFPLVPYYRHESGLKIIRDPRAYSICPLSSKRAYEYLNPKFVKKTESVFHLLTQFHEIRIFLDALSDILDDFLKFELTEDFRYDK